MALRKNSHITRGQMVEEYQVLDEAHEDSGWISTALPFPALSKTEDYLLCASVTVNPHTRCYRVPDISLPNVHKGLLWAVQIYHSSQWVRALCWSPCEKHDGENRSPAARVKLLYRQVFFFVHCFSCLLKCLNFPLMIPSADGPNWINITSWPTCLPLSVRLFGCVCSRTVKSHDWWRTKWWKTASDSVPRASQIYQGALHPSLHLFITLDRWDYSWIKKSHRRDILYLSNKDMLLGKKRLISGNQMEKALLLFWLIAPVQRNDLLFRQENILFHYTHWNLLQDFILIPASH